MAYLLLFIFGITSTTIMFPPTELALLVLANMDQTKPIVMFGMTFDAAHYGARFPWLLPIVAAVSTNIGNTMWYLIGSGMLNIKNKFFKKYLDKVREFDIEKLGRAKEAVLWSACLVSVPPVTAVAFASGVVRYGLVRFHLVTIIPKIIRYYLVLILARYAFKGLLALFT